MIFHQTDRNPDRIHIGARLKSLNARLCGDGVCLFDTSFFLR